MDCRGLNLKSKYIYTESYSISEESIKLLDNYFSDKFEVEKLSSIEYLFYKKSKTSISKLWKRKMKIVLVKNQDGEQLVNLETQPPMVSPIYFWLAGLLACILFMFLSSLNNKLGIFALATFFLIAVITRTQRIVISTKSLISSFKSEFK